MLRLPLISRNRRKDSGTWGYGRRKSSSNRSSSSNSRSSRSSRIVEAVATLVIVVVVEIIAAVMMLIKMMMLMMKVMMLCQNTKNENTIQLTDIAYIFQVRLLPFRVLLVSICTADVHVIICLYSWRLDLLLEFPV